jgi:hypothetical protein
MRATLRTRIVHAHYFEDRHVVGYRGMRRPGRVLGWRGQSPAEDRTDREPDPSRFRFGDGDRQRVRNTNGHAHRVDSNGDANAVPHPHRSSVGNVRL